MAVVEKSMNETRAMAEASLSKMAEMSNAFPAVDAAYQQAIRDLAATSARISTARAHISQHQESIAAVDGVIASSRSALEKLPADMALTEALATLTRRRNELDAALAAEQQALQNSTAAEAEARAKREAAQVAFENAFTERARRQAAAEAARAEADAASARAAAAKSAFESAVGSLAASWSNEGLVASLKPLTPEQMCASVFRVTGVYENYKAVEIAELDKSAPMADADKQDPAKVQSRLRDLEQRVYDKLLKPYRPTYIQLYGASAGAPQDEFFASADQALYTANADAIVSWSGLQGNNVTKRMVDEADGKKAAQILYETVLCRAPSPQEVADVDQYLASRPKEQKPQAAQELVWSLIASVEFRMNH